MRRIPSLLAVGTLLAACQSTLDRAVIGSATKAAPAGAVDSAIPREEALRRFREGLPSVDSLAGGATSQAGLVREFVRALERSDTATLGRLVMSRQEFAWVYYPDTPQGLPPYDLSPDLLWFLLENRGVIGLSHLVQERMGFPLGYSAYQCDPVPSVEGENRVWGPCGVTRRQPDGSLVTERLFGLILERRGRFKFVSYANKLD
jgi:hypothetical protein